MTLPLLLSLFSACSTERSTDTGAAVDPGNGAPPGETVMGSVERRSAPSTAHVADLAAANNDFGLRLLQEVYAAEPDNTVVSPWSLQVVLAQVYAGARGDAKTAIGGTFGWTLADADLHEAFDATDLAVQAHNDAAAEPPVAVTSTNQIFVTTGYPLGAPWLDTLSEFYGTGVQTMDFAADPAGVAGDINDWIAARTGDRIKDLITEGTVSDNRMLLVNAIYFKVSWFVPFAEENTTDKPFTLVDGSEVSVPMMSGSVNVHGAEGPGYFVADLPYSDDGLVMTLVIPDAGSFPTTVDTLAWADIQTTIDGEAICEECPVQLPKFEVKSRPPVFDTLTAMGMAPAFGGDYTDISPELTLTNVEQAGFVAVNEIGTEAAAATVAEFSDSATEPPFGPIVVARPFLWFIREVETGAVLFSGVVVDPR